MFPRFRYVARCFVCFFASSGRNFEKLFCFEQCFFKIYFSSFSFPLLCEFDVTASTQPSLFSASRFFDSQWYFGWFAICGSVTVSGPLFFATPSPCTWSVYFRNSSFNWFSFENFQLFVEFVSFCCVALLLSFKQKYVSIVDGATAENPT